jgi:hypothetical protein
MLAQAVTLLTFIRLVNSSSLSRDTEYPYWLLPWFFSVPPGKARYVIITYPGFALLIRRVLDLIIEFIGPLYDWSPQFTNHYLTQCLLLRLDTLDFWPHFTTPLLRCIPSRLLTVPSYNSSAQTPQKTPSSVAKNACLLVRHLAIDVLFFSAYALTCIYWTIA